MKFNLYFALFLDPNPVCICQKVRIKLLYIRILLFVHLPFYYQFCQLGTGEDIPIANTDQSLLHFIPILYVTIMQKFHY